MFSVKAAAIPDGGLINSYEIQAGCYTDCFVAEISQDVTLSDFILAFFNTPADSTRQCNMLVISYE